MNTAQQRALAVIAVIGVGVLSLLHLHMPQSAIPQTASVAGSQSSPIPATPFSWLIQDVCVDAANKPVAADPYSGCPTGTTERDLQPGDALPYHKFDQPAVQGHDSYPVTTLKGSLLSINPFDYGAPSGGAFQSFDQAFDGYDIYGVQGAWASVGETRDAGSFPTTFFTSGCLPYNGWVFFPTSLSLTDYSTVGSTFASISGRHWIQNGETWPGTCPTLYGTGSQTTWQVLHNFAFGGMYDNPTKTMDAIYSVHGFSSTPAFLATGHLEVFYFTKQYGATRWEVWYPAQQSHVANTKTCNGPATMLYQGVTFTRTDCRDWTHVVMAPTPVTPAVLPIPDLNLLKDFTFATTLTPSWARVGTSVQGNSINWRRIASTKALDVQYSQTKTGVYYLATNCAGACAAGQMIYQDVPIAAIHNGAYVYGASIRSENAKPGTLRLSLMQLNAQGQVLDTHSFDSTVGTTSNSRVDPAQSLYRSATFVAQTAPIGIKPGATRLRFAFIPVTQNTFDIFDAWLMPQTVANTSVPPATTTPPNIPERNCSNEPGYLKYLCSFL